MVTHLPLAGEYQEASLAGNITDALPALSNLRRLRLDPTWDFPKGLGQLKKLEELELGLGPHDAFRTW
jgi:hypothetical protein